MTPQQMDEVVRDCDAPAGRESARRAMRYVQNWDRECIDRGILDFMDAIPTDQQVREDDALAGVDLFILLPREHAKMILAFAVYGVEAATRAYQAGETMWTPNPGTAGEDAT